MTQRQQTPAEAVLANNNINIAMLKDAYNLGTKNGSLKIADVNQTIANIISSLTVDWSTYTLTSYPDSTQVIEFIVPNDTTLIVPGSLAKNDTIKYHTKTSAVFILRQDTINISFFMKTVEDCTAAGYQSVINNVFYNNEPQTFNGNVFYFTLARQFINGYQWQNGTVTKALSIGSASSGNTQQAQAKKKGKLVVDVAQLINCVTTTYEIYYVTKDAQGNIVNWQQLIATYEVTNCDEVDPSGSAGSGTSTTIAGGGGVNGAPTLPPPCPVASGPSVQAVKGKLIIDVAQGGSGNGSGGTTNPCVTPTSQATVTDSIKNPCIKGAVENAVSDGLDGYTANIANAVFGSSASFDLNFRDSSTLPNNTDGQTNCQGNPNINGFFIADVDLNSNTLSTASNEYVAVTAMHEILHAYMTLNGTLGALNQHTTMVTTYLTKMEADLQALYPSMSLADATALCWGGLQDTQAWANLVQSNPALANSIISTNAAYKNSNGTKGHRCN